MLHFSQSYEFKIVVYGDSTNNSLSDQNNNDNQEVKIILFGVGDPTSVESYDLSNYLAFESNVGLKSYGGGFTKYEDTTVLSNTQKFPIYAEFAFMNDFFNYFFQFNSDFTFPGLVGNHTNRLPSEIQGEIPLRDDLYNIPLDYTFDEKGRMVKMEGGFWGAKGEDITIRY